MKGAIKGAVKGAIDQPAVDRRQFMIGGIAAGALTAPRLARAQGAPVKIRLGWVVVAASTAPLVLEKKDLLKNFGRSYVAEATRFEGTPPVITAPAAGELDIGPLAFSSFGLAIDNAHMDDLRVICDERMQHRFIKLNNSLCGIIGV